MKARLLLGVSLGICFLIAPNASLAGGKPISCGPDVNNVVVDIWPSTTLTPYEIVSDGGTYQNLNARNDKVVLGFQISNCSYDFTMNLSQSSRKIKVFLPNLETTSWFFNFDRLGSVPVMDGGTAHTTWCNTAPTRNPDGSFNDIDGIPLDNYGGCGSDVGGTFARRSVAFLLDDSSQLRFQKSAFEGNSTLTSGTNFIKVYHPSPNTWILEPETPAVSVLLKTVKGSQVAESLQPMRFKVMIMINL